VHQAAGVDAHQDVGLGGAQMLSFSRPIASEMWGKLTENVPPKPQHCSASPNSTRLTPGDRAHQRRRRLGAVRAARVARAVEGDGRVKPPRPRRHPEAVDDEIRQLPRAPGELPRPRAGRARARTPAAPVKHHRGAGARRHDHRSVALEGAHHVAHHPARGRPVAGVERRLAAAGLRLGETPPSAEVFQHLHRGHRGVVVKRVAEARGHQLHFLAQRRLALDRHHGAKRARCRIRSAPQSRFCGKWRAILRSRGCCQSPSLPDG
jgi:hypothetical protein